MSENKSEPIVVSMERFEDLKPPTQSVQMESIAPQPIVMGGIDLIHDWFTLINSAPFQMFCCETRAQGGQGTHNIEDWIKQAIESEVLTDENKLFKEFETWHTAKGYWPNETVYGELK